MASYIFSAAEVEANSDFIRDRKVHTALPVTGESCQLVWAKFEPGGTYQLHSHTHEQMSVMVSGRMRLTVGDEVRDIGPGDMWYAPANVQHGGEILGDEPVVLSTFTHPLPSGLLSGLRRTRILPIQVFIKM